MSNFSNLNLKDIVSSCNLPNGRVIILFLLVMHHIYYIYNFYWDDKNKDICVDYSLTELISLSKSKTLTGLIPFENHNALLVSTFDGKYLYFKN